MLVSLFWDVGEYYGKPLEGDAGVVIRILKGDFVIFSKASINNKNLRTYDGRHNRLGDDGFKKHIREVIDHLK